MIRILINITCILRLNTHSCSMMIIFSSLAFWLFITDCMKYCFIFFFKFSHYFRRYSYRKGITTWTLLKSVYQMECLSICFYFRILTLMLQPLVWWLHKQEDKFTDIHISRWDIFKLFMVHFQRRDNANELFFIPLDIWENCIVYVSLDVSFDG